MKNEKLILALANNVKFVLEALIVYEREFYDDKDLRKGIETNLEVLNKSLEDFKADAEKKDADKKK